MNLYRNGIITVDNGFIIADMMGKIVKYDLEGNRVWTKSGDAYNHALTLVEDNGIVVVSEEGYISKYNIVNRTELDNILGEVEKLVESDYSSESWQILQNALINTDNFIKQSQLNAKVKEIQDAIYSLKPDRTSLDKLLEDVAKLTSTDYSTTSWNELQAAINDTDDLADKTEVDAKVKEIQDAIDNLGVDRSELNKLLDDVSKLEERDYSKESWKNLSDLVDNVEDLTKQSEINRRVDDIKKAIEDLTIDTSKLEEIVERVKTMDKENYTKDSLDNLMKVVDSVEEYTKQYEVDAKVEEIEDALSKLKLDPSKVQIKKGDMDRNGVITANDASIILDLYKNGNATPEDILIGDMDNSGTLTANDASMILDMYKNGK